MPELRWILLVLGVLFIAALAWWELRRPRQAHRGEIEPPRVHREPTFSMPDIRPREPMHSLPVIEVSDDSLIGLRVDGMRVEEEIASEEEAIEDSAAAPPAEREPAETVTWPEPAWEGAEPSVVDEATEAEKHAPASREVTPPKPASFQSATHKTVNPGFSPHGADADWATATHTRIVFTDPELRDSEAGSARSAKAEIDIAPAVSKPSMFDGRAAPVELPPVTEPIVDWPEDATRQIIALRLVAPTDRFSGRSLRQALAAEGFMLGKFSIFHKAGEDNRAILSAASLTKPGTFDLDSMDMQRFVGLNLFAVIPGPLPPRKAFDELLISARNLNDRLHGGLQDEQGQPLTPTRISTIREGLHNDGQNELPP